MQVALLAALLSVALYPARHCPPETVFAADGERVETTKADALAIGWSMLRPYRDVTISVRAATGHDDYSIVTTYLMTRIGPLTHPHAEIARTSYELPPSFDGSWILFEHLQLPAGEYWLVFERPPHAQHGEPEWRVVTLKGFSLGFGNKFLGTRSYSWVNHRTEYTPDATYTPTMVLQGYPVTISGVPEY